MTFEHNNVRKNLFLSVCFCWDSRLSLRETQKKIIFRGAIQINDSYLELSFRHSKVYRLHAIVHDAASKGPSYCYFIGQGEIHGCRVTCLDCSFASRKLLSTFHFQFCRLLRQCIFHCTRH